MRLHDKSSTEGPWLVSCHGRMVVVVPAVETGNNPGKTVRERSKAQASGRRGIAS